MHKRIGFREKFKMVNNSFGSERERERERKKYQF
jgi:hypothetical protein